MNKDTLDQQIKRRADERINQRLKVFKATVLRACDELFSKKGAGSSIDPYTKAFPDHVRKACAVLASENHRKGWPSQLWEMEIEAVTNEVLGTMNELQKVLLSRGETENEAEES